MTSISAIAHTNIALIKYWGKKSGQGNLPATGSLSLTLDQFFTTTTLEPAETDSFALEGNKDSSRVLSHIDYFRKMTGKDLKFKVISHNQVATASGLASSASGFAALTVALAKAFSLELSATELSRIARRGSGSAARSIFPGFVLLRADSIDPFAEPVASLLTNNLAMVVVECTRGPKSISSREAMNRVVQDSVFYDAFLANHKPLLESAVCALHNSDFKKLGSCMEQSTLQMHATMLGCSEPFWYFNATTLLVMSKVRTLRDQGLGCYFTMDAGPHVKVLCEAAVAGELSKILGAIEGVSQVTLCKAGQGARVLE